jgi:hypothetical protein
MTDNPYAPPTAPVSDVANTARSATAPYALYSPRQIFIAAFVGSPLAASWFASRNLLALSQAQLANRILIGGYIATAAVLALGYALPDDLHIPNTLIPLTYSILLRLYAQHLFGGAFDKHVQSGGRRGSYWTVVGLSLAYLLAIAVALVACAFAWSYFTGSKFL